ncbi:MAG TPA: glycosyltransferase [Nitrospiraceae bacterium]|nr:glycosyltransferase [Nitrospiraceae bacterium]
MSLVHVCHVVHSFGIGGTENGIVNLINNADPSKFRFSVCSFSPECDSVQRIVGRKVSVHVLKKGLGNDWRLPVQLATLFKNANVDIVHTHAWGTYLEGLLAAKIAAVPALVHGEHGLGHLNKWRRIFAYRCLQYATDQFITVSEDLRYKFVYRFKVSPHKVKTIVNGVNLQRFSSDPALRIKKREELVLEDDHVAIGSIGRLCEDKDYRSLLRAMALVVRSNPQARLLLIGKGPERPALEALSKELNINEYVRFLGNRDDTAELLNAMDIFASSSIREGIPNSILEAMSAGVAVVATKVGGIPEIVVHGETGLLVNAGQPRAVADSLIKLINAPELRLQFSAACRLRVQDHFSLDGMVQAYERTYLEIFESKKMYV